MLSFSRTLLAGALISSCLCFSMRSHAQTIYQSDFDEQGDSQFPAGWIFRAARGTCTGRWDAEHSASGKRSLRLVILDDPTARAHWALKKRIPLEPNTNYEFSIQAMTYGITGEAYAICYENGKETPDYWHHTRKLKGTSEWQTYNIRFTSRPDAESLAVVLKLRHGLGYAWFDDIALRKISQSALPSPAARVFPPDDGFPLQIMWTPAQWTSENILHLVGGRTNVLSLFFRGTPAAVADTALILDLPNGFGPVGPLFRGRGPMPENKSSLQTTTDSSRTTWRVPVTVDALKKGLKDRFSWETYHHLALKVDETTARQGTIRWQIANAGEVGPPHDLPFEIHPGWAAPKLCDTFRIYVQHTGGIRHPDSAVRQQLMEYLELAGIEGGLGLSFYEPGLIDADRELEAHRWQMHTWRFDAYGGRVPDAPLIDRKGNNVGGKVCPSAQIAHVEPWFGKLKAYYQAKLAPGLQRLIIDYEPPVRNVCFCETCKMNFAQFAGLPEQEIQALTGDEILKKYPVKWGAFRARQNGDIVALHCNLIREITPNCTVGICSWPGTEYMVQTGGDISLFENTADFHAPMIYTKDLSYHRSVEETCQRTTKPVLPFIELSDISQPRHLTPDELRMNLLATAASGGQGAFLWVGIECLDALYLAAAREALDTIREVRRTVPLTRNKPAWVQTEYALDQDRQIVIDGERRSLPDASQHPYLRCHMWGNSSEIALLVLNYDRESPQELTLKATVTAVPILQHHSTTEAEAVLETSDPNTWRITVPAYSDATIILKRK